ncbi:MAG: F0F1 ATP synthase subunit epsilon [Chloroflexota bacterium]|nr:MAG: F0F1 ATP synthase subunit epsilon [Chloroflexota bacterium]
MATLRLEIITAERQVFSDDVNVVVAPGIQGELGILPHHAPLMTMLKPGELLIRKDSEETYMSVSGGFLEIRPDKIIILADACERAEEIDIDRAEEAKRRAEERLKTHPSELDMAQAQAALLRSLVRLRVAERRRRKSVTGR